MTTNATDQHDGAPTELRLALVCYGGVSLAIYMHGVTKELHKLQHASQSLSSLGADTANPYPEDDTRRTYFDALRSLAGPDGRPMTVTLDVISGTSAGGINGVVLAKVLARNGSQDALKKLWLDEGDFKRLLRAPRIGGWRLRAAIAGLRTLGHLDADWSPLRGEHMSQLLYDALSTMETADGERDASLVPDGGSLDLFVTMTDLDGLPMRVPTGTGGFSQRETDHAQVIHLVTGPRDDTFGPDATGMLAFGARATSSFPGAFAAVSLESFAGEIGRNRKSNPTLTSRQFASAYSTAAEATSASFVDGGVLDNAPFDLVVDAITRKRAQSQVVRRLLYIQPDPGVALGNPAGEVVHRKRRHYLQALLDAVVTVRGTHSILRPLTELRDLNLRISEVATIADLQEDQVRRAVEAAWNTAGEGAASTAWEITDRAQVEAISNQFYTRAQTFVGAGYPGYCRLKVDATAVLLGQETARLLSFPDDSSEAALLEAAIGSWARAQVSWSNLEQDPIATDDQSALNSVLGAADVPYRQRRLMFILSGINDLYQFAGSAPDAPTRAQLDLLKKQAWDLLEQIREAPGQALHGSTGGGTGPLPEVTALGELVRGATYVDPDGFATAHAMPIKAVFELYRQRLGDLLGTTTQRMWDAFVATTAGWSQVHKAALITRFVGFPLWDALIFPTIALSQLPQFTPIGVTQLSPLAATALTPPTSDAGDTAGRPTKLKGIALKHFGAFAERSWRENDYLWGRLDSVELILQTLRDASGARPVDATGSPPGAGIDELFRAGLRQVLDSETDLSTTTDLRAHVASQIPSATVPDQRIRTVRRRPG